MIIFKENSHRVNVFKFLLSNMQHKLATYFAAFICTLKQTFCDSTLACMFHLQQCCFCVQGTPLIENKLHFVTFYVSYALILVEFCLSLFADLSAAKIVPCRSPAHTAYIQHDPALIEDGEALMKNGLAKEAESKPVRTVTSSESVNQVSVK